jgi:hypothetical protein
MVRKKDQIINDSIKKRGGKKDVGRITNEERISNSKWVKRNRCNKRFKEIKRH